MRRGGGFTLIELVIATVIFTVAGLGLAAASAAVARQVSATTIRDRALSLVRSHAESPEMTSCAGVGEGGAELPAISLVWTSEGERARTVDQRVARIDSRGTFTDRFLSAALCE